MVMYLWPSAPLSKVAPVGVADTACRTQKPSKRGSWGRCLRNIGKEEDLMEGDSVGLHSASGPDSVCHIAEGNQSSRMIREVGELLL